MTDTGRTSDTTRLLSATTRQHPAVPTFIPAPLHLAVTYRTLRVLGVVCHQLSPLSGCRRTDVDPPFEAPDLLPERVPNMPRPPLPRRLRRSLRVRNPVRLNTIRAQFVTPRRIEDFRTRHVPRLRPVPARWRGGAPIRRRVRHGHRLGPPAEIVHCLPVGARAPAPAPMCDTPCCALRVGVGGCGGLAVAEADARDERRLDGVERPHVPLAAGRAHVAHVVEPDATG